MSEARYGNTRVAKIRAAYNDLRSALAEGDLEAAQAARVLLADDVALSRMAEAVHDGPLGADDYWYSAATPQGGWCVDVVRAALRALAAVKP